MIGLALDVDEGNMYLIRNNVFDKGRPIFTNVRFSLEGGNSIFPAISCSGGCELEYMCERCDYDERKDFKFQPPDGYEFIFQHRKLVMKSVMSNFSCICDNTGFVQNMQGDVKYEDQNYIEKLYTLVIFDFILCYSCRFLDSNLKSLDCFTDLLSFRK